MKSRNGFFCIPIFLFCVFCSIAVPMFNAFSEADSVQRAENVHMLTNGSVHTEDIFAALEIQPVKVLVHSEKRILMLFLFTASAVSAETVFLFSVVKFVQKKLILSKNKYLKAIIYLQTLL